MGFLLDELINNRELETVKTTEEMYWSAKGITYVYKIAAGSLKKALTQNSKY